MEILVGVFVALGLGALLVLALEVSNLSSGGSGGRGYDVEARFDNIGQLKVRAPVKLAGVNVGQVTDITVDPQTFEAVARLRISDRFAAIPTDTSAQIYTSGLLGEQYVALEPGGEETFLTDGSTIKLTQSALVLEQLISQFMFKKAAGDEDR